MGGVKHQPEPPSSISRIGVKDQPERCQTSGDAGMTSITRNTTASGAPGRNRTCDTRFRKPLLYPLSYEGEGGGCRKSGRKLPRNLLVTSPRKVYSCSAVQPRVRRCETPPSEPQRHDEELPRERPRYR